MIRQYYCRECGYRFESDQQEEFCWECEAENLQLEGNYDGNII